MLEWDSALRRDEIAIEIRRVVKHPPYPMHSHRFAELVMVLGGRGVHLSQDGSSTIIKSGDVILIPEGQSHGYKDTQNLELMDILFKLDQLGLPLKELNKIPGFRVLFGELSSGKRIMQYRLSEGCQRVLDVVRQLEAESMGQEPGRNELLRAHFIILLVTLSRVLFENQHGSRRRLRQALWLMEEHFDQPHRVSSLASSVGMAHRTFTRTFRKTVGVSPGEYMLNLRIHQAKVLLEEEDLTVTEISQRVGFDDSNYFSRLFRRKTGKSPRQWRQTTTKAGRV